MHIQTNELEKDKNSSLQAHSMSPTIDDWITPKKIYDAHLHIFNYRGMEKRAERMGFLSLDQLVEYMSERVGRLFTLPPKNDLELLEMWINELDKHNVDKAVVLPDWNDDSIVSLAAEHYPDRFIRFLMINPTVDNAFPLLETVHSKVGLHGIKLYPPSHYYHAYDDRLTPFYEFCENNGLLVTYHMGVSVGKYADLRFMNPSDVSPVAREFPKLNILFAHFATGYLRELLFLMYHVDNVYAESSSSNKWMHYLPYKINLKDVFEKIISLKGSQKIIFGTDSTMFPRGWRNSIYQTQLAVCNDLNLTQEQIDQIFYRNLESLLPKI